MSGVLLYVGRCSLKSAIVSKIAPKFLLGDGDSDGFQLKTNTATEGRRSVMNSTANRRSILNESCGCVAVVYIPSTEKRRKIPTVQYPPIEKKIFDLVMCAAHRLRMRIWCECLPMRCPCGYHLTRAATIVRVSPSLDK